jgi:hypothetical protein
MRHPAVELQPKRPPGRVDRKAAAYAVQIVQLRDAGYTFEAIRDAMAEIGIELSTSALRREVRRLRSQSMHVLSRLTSDPRPAPADPLDNAQPTSPASRPTVAAPSVSRGRDIAEVFFAANPSNSLLRTQEVP